MVCEVCGEDTYQFGRWVFTPSLIGDPLVAGWSLDGDPLDPWMVRRGDRTPARKDTPPPFVNQEDSPQNVVEKAVKTGEQRSNAAGQAFVQKIVKKLFVDICENNLLETCIDPATGIVVPTS